MDDGTDTDTDAVAEFARQARIYCAWAERESTDAEVPAFEALMMITAVYLAGLRLPAADWLLVESEEAAYEALETVEDTHTNIYMPIFKKAKKVGLGYYGHIFDPLVVPPPVDAASLGDIADDIADIYRDLWKGLRAYDAGLHASAIWHWRADLNCHWGRHAAAAIYALHVASLSYERDV